MPENPVAYVYFAIFALLGIAVGFRYLKNFLAPVMTAKATVVHKQKVDTFSKYSGTGKHTRYAVTFSMGDKKRSFYVSELSYGGYRIGETGMLKYKGDRLIDFT